MIKVIRCRNSHEPTIQKTINTYIQLFRKGKDHTITDTLSVSPEYQEVILRIGKSLCVHMPRTATIISKDFLIRVSSRIKGSIGLGVTVHKDNMENVYMREASANTSLENVLTW